MDIAKYEPAIIVLTPVKNESWILKRFLSVTSQFADHIIIADQNSEDDSRDIARGFPKVRLIDNQEALFDNQARQKLLIAEARRLVSGPRILLALDADEILCADALQSKDWQQMLAAAPGTVLCFEKPTLYNGTSQCIRYPACDSPLGYVDDGADYQGLAFHSNRVPLPPGAPRLKLPELKMIHYALARLDAQRSKVRLYSVRENDTGFTPLWKRRISYSRRRDYCEDGPVERVPQQWFSNWEAMGIDMRSIETADYYWWDAELLLRLGKNGCRRYWLDDIWDANWEDMLEHARQRGITPLPTVIERPSPAHKLAGALVEIFGRTIETVKKILRRLRH